MGSGAESWGSTMRISRARVESAPRYFAIVRATRGATAEPWRQNSTMAPTTISGFSAGANEGSGQFQFDGRFSGNGFSDFLLGILNLTREDVGRFRDAWVEDDGKVIAVYTRNGGGNRDHWSFSYPDETPGEKCPCTGCIITHRLPKHALYTKDQDDEFDCTYCTVWFRVPERQHTFLKDLAEAPRDMDERWQRAIDELKAGKRPDVIEAMRPTMEKIAEWVKKGGDVKATDLDQAGSGGKE